MDINGLADVLLGRGWDRARLAPLATHQHVRCQMARIVDIFAVYEWQRHPVGLVLVLSISSSATLSSGSVALVETHLEVERHIIALCCRQLNRLDNCRQFPGILQVNGSLLYSRPFRSLLLSFTVVKHSGIIL